MNRVMAPGHVCLVPNAGPERRVVVQIEKVQRTITRIFQKS